MKETLLFHSDISPVSFTNDLGITDIGDPFMLKVAPDEYYLYCTSAPNGFFCWHSKDMIHWDSKKMCYVMKEDSWGRECFWAPEVVAYQDKYYMFYTAMGKDGLRLGLAISASPDGPFADYKNEPFLDYGYSVIDANVFIDEDGSKYLYYVRDCADNIINGIHTSQLYGVQLSDDLTSIIGTPTFLTTPDVPWEQIAGGYMWNEGPEMIKHNGTYYLSYSADRFDSPGYSLGYAVSGNPLGPFRKLENNRILYSAGLEGISGPGHHSFVFSPDDTELWIAYHSHTNIKNPSGNRKVNLARAGFSKDGSLYINGPLITAQPLPSGIATTNVSSHFHATVNETKISKLTDGMIQVHEEPGNTALIPVGAHGQATVSLYSDTEVSVAVLALYAGHRTAGEIASVRLCINQEIYSEEYVVLANASSPILLFFDPVSARQIDILLSANTGITQIALSEIEIFSLK